MAGGHLGTATEMEKSPLNQMKERMKNEKLDELDGGQSIFAATRRRRDRLLLKAIPLADISLGIVEPLMIRG